LPAISVSRSFRFHFDGFSPFFIFFISSSLFPAYFLDASFGHFHYGFIFTDILLPVTVHGALIALG